MDTQVGITVGLMIAIVIIRAMWETETGRRTLRRFFREVLDILTLAYPKPEDDEAGVNLKGQGR